MRSSGMSVDWDEAEADCRCGFSGEVAQWSDPEVMQFGFTCPGCGFEHVENVGDTDDE